MAAATCFEATTKCKDTKQVQWTQSIVAVVFALSVQYPKASTKGRPHSKRGSHTVPRTVAHLVVEHLPPALEPSVQAVVVVGDAGHHHTPTLLPTGKSVPLHIPQSRYWEI
jgi:hypothetical protein